MLEICSDLFKTCLKIYYFCQHSKRSKNGQMAKPFYFWQTVSKRPNLVDLALKRPNDNPGVQPNPRVATNVSTEVSLSPHL